MSFRMPKGGNEWSYPVDYQYFTQGGVGVDDFEDTFRHVKSAKKDKPKKKKGCPGNDFGAHIYVWTTEVDAEFPWHSDGLFFRVYGFRKYEYKVCAGCRKRAGYRLSEAYTKKFKKEGRFGHEEYKDPVYREAEREYWRSYRNSLVL